MDCVIKWGPIRSLVEIASVLLGGKAAFIRKCSFSRKKITHIADIEDRSKPNSEPPITAIAVIT